jgi:hypothetical protein
MRDFPAFSVILALFGRPGHLARARAVPILGPHLRYTLFQRRADIPVFPRGGFLLVYQEIYRVFTRHLTTHVRTE